MGSADERVLEWEILGREQLSDYGVFSVSRLAARHVCTRKHKTFSVIHCPDWVNVMCLTAEHHLVLVRQYRPGVGRITLEIPGGVVEPGEAPSDAAARELWEETGYQAARWHHLGSTAPNPAFQSNTCHLWLALDATRVGMGAPDPDEQIRVLTCPLARVPELVRDGEINHALVLAAFARFTLLAGGWQPPFQR